MDTRKWLCAVLLLAGACSPAPAVAPTAAPATTSPPTATEVAAAPTATDVPLPFELSSPGFAAGDVIPARFACTGENLSPQLDWGDPPAGTQSFALLFDDPTLRPGWVHWIVYNLPAELRSLPEGIQPGEQAAGGLHGANSWGRLEYGGPCPPQGSAHTYIFILYALDTMLPPQPASDKAGLLAAIEGHVLAQIELSAQFSR
jgi:Raf kinase inhibitor-like YbhB/YbcL family protein